MPVAVEYPESPGLQLPRGGIFARESYVALTLALAIYTGAFIAENVRAGIQAVSHGQTEAAFALGLRPKPDHAAGHPAPGAARHHPADDLAVPEPHQELLAGAPGRLHGCDGHAGRHHAEPDRQGVRDAVPADGLLPDRLAGHRGDHEPLQREREAGRAHLGQRHGLLVPGAGRPLDGQLGVPEEGRRQDAPLLWHPGRAEFSTGCSTPPSCSWF